jgi:hypothetical protein
MFDAILSQFVLCTDQKDDIEHLDAIGDKLKQQRYDVTDIYSIEQEEVKEARPRFKFSYGEYVTKICLGAIDSSYNLDQPTPCCTIQ